MSGLKPEERAREWIDRNLYAANLSFQRGDKASPF